MGQSHLTSILTMIGHHPNAFGVPLAGLLLSGLTALVHWAKQYKNADLIATAALLGLGAAVVIVIKFGY